MIQFELTGTAADSQASEVPTGISTELKLSYCNASWLEQFEVSAEAPASKIKMDLVTDSH